MKRILILLLSFAFLILTFDFCLGTVIVKDTQADFTAYGSLFENTNATIESGNVILDLSGGEGLWTVNGVAVCAATDNQSFPQLISDDSGGAIIAWFDLRDNATTGRDIYVQKIDDNGNPQWSPANGVAVCTAVNEQYNPQLISDGSGGAIIVWYDFRDQFSTSFDIYAQRIDSDGQVHSGWAPNGVAICTANDIQYGPQIVSDGSGGAIIAWRDDRNTMTTMQDIYAQRIDGNGQVKWAPNGVAVCAATDNQSLPQLISDNSGGAIIVWFDFRNSATTGYDIYAQKINSNGNPQWSPANGVAICTAANGQYNPQLISDGSGGAIITWWDRREGITNSNIYAQRINGSGVVQWAGDGVAVCAAAEDQEVPRLVSDSSGGAIVVWEDGRKGNDDVYAQRIDSGGVGKWATDGVAICSAADYQHSPILIPDGSGGAVVAWYDYRSGSSDDIYAQKIDSGGNVRWTADGVAICVAADYQNDPQLVPDESGGAIIVWQDNRNSGTTGVDVYAQRIDDVYFVSGKYTTEMVENTDPYFSGWTTFSWAGSGSITAEVRTATSYGGLNSASWAPVSSGGDIPNRDDINYKWLHARMYFAPSSLKTVTSRLESLSLSYDDAGTGEAKAINVISGPNPFDPAIESTDITYELSRDIAVQIYIFGLSGELIIKKVISPPDEGAHSGPNSVPWDGRNQAGEIVPNGVYLYKITANGKVLGSGKIMILK